MSTKWWSSLFKIFLVTLIVVVASTELQSVHDLQQYKNAVSLGQMLLMKSEIPDIHLLNEKKQKSRHQLYLAQRSLGLG